MLTKQRLLFLFLFIAVIAVASLSGPSALNPGETLPDIEVAGWTNGAMPDTKNQIVVLEVFATW